MLGVSTIRMDIPTCACESIILKIVTILIHNRQSIRERVVGGIIRCPGSQRGKVVKCDVVTCVVAKIANSSINFCACDFTEMETNRKKTVAN
jgi:hypothetical protein